MRFWCLSTTSILHTISSFVASHHCLETFFGDNHEVKISWDLGTTWAYIFLFADMICYQKDPLSLFYQTSIYWYIVTNNTIGQYKLHGQEVSWLKSDMYDNIKYFSCVCDTDHRGIKPWKHASYGDIKTNHSQYMTVGVKYPWHTMTKQQLKEHLMPK